MSNARANYLRKVILSNCEPLGVLLYKSLTSTGMNFSAVCRYFLMKFSGNLYKGLNRGTCKDFGDRETRSGFFWWLKMVKNTGELCILNFTKVTQVQE